MGLRCLHLRRGPASPNTVPEKRKQKGVRACYGLRVSCQRVIIDFQTVWGKSAGTFRGLVFSVPPKERKETGVYPPFDRYPPLIFFIAGYYSYDMICSCVLPLYLLRLALHGQTTLPYLQCVYVLVLRTISVLKFGTDTGCAECTILDGWNISLSCQEHIHTEQ